MLIADSGTVGQRPTIRPRLLKVDSKRLLVSMSAVEFELKDNDTKEQRPTHSAFVRRIYGASAIVQINRRSKTF